MKTKQLAKYMYEFRLKHGIHGDKEHDYFSALHFSEAWQGEIEKRRFYEKNGYEIGELNSKGEPRTRRSPGVRRKMSDKALFLCWLRVVLYGWNEVPKKENFFQQLISKLWGLGE